MKTGKLLKENCSKKLETCWLSNKLLFIEIFQLYLDFRRVKCGHHVHNGNVIAWQPLSVRRITFTACVSVAVVYICEKSC